MEQKFEGMPQAEIKLEGHKLIRGDVTNDWGLRVQWLIKRDGQVIANPNARADLTYEHPDKTPGTYEVILQMWKYVNYRKKDGAFVDSTYVDISNSVSYTI